MPRLLPSLFTVLLLGGALVAVACDDGSGVDTEQAQDRASQTANDVREQANDVWSDLRTNGERLIDDVQTRNDPDAKNQLLNRCRDAEEQLRKDENANADRVNQLCDDIRNANPEDSDAWQAIKARFDELNNVFRG